MLQATQSSSNPARNEAVEAMSTISGQTPPGPADAYDPSEDLLEWMQLNFERYGDIYSARIFGASVYVVNKWLSMSW